MDDYQMTIGIECHVQLATTTKLFSPADNDARDAEPNSKVHEIDFALPGMLPVLNKQAINLAIRAAKALNSPVAHVSRFDRKHYFYPDLPNGYQITQMYQPIIQAGYVIAPLNDSTSVRVGIHHAHLEMDAGKLSHFNDYSLVDLNRAGTPLIEIVSEPDMHSAAEARAYAEELHRLMIYAGVTLGNLYHGNMRFDVNVSVAKRDATELGKRAEIKNLNSFRSVERAANYEFERQVALIRSGGNVVQETRGWSDDTGKTSSQRSKEDAQDYRYMPDADIPPVVLEADYIERIQSEVVKLPADYRQAFRGVNVDVSVMNRILSDRAYAEMVFATQEAAGDQAARRVANWISSGLTEEDADTTVTAIATADLVELCQMTDNAEITSNAATELFNQLMSGAKQPRRLAEAANLLQVSDLSAIKAIVERVLADPASSKSVSDIKAGKEKAIGFIVGLVMKESHGKANPSMVQQLIREQLQL